MPHLTKELKNLYDKIETNKEDPKKIFNLEGDFTVNDLRKAYKKLSMIAHPDKNHGNEKEATVLFKTIQHYHSELKRVYFNIVDQAN